MKRLLLLLLLALFAANSVSCQTNHSQSFNFDFETLNSGMPEQWSSVGNDEYALGVDSLHAKSGKYAVFIESKPNSEAGFKAWQLMIPAKYDGKQITLSGYIKTEEVTDGYAGLWMRIDPDVAFDNMHNRGVVGSTDWEKYEITLNLNPDVATQIVVGGLLVGRGKMWIDDLQVTIDGKKIEDIQAKVYPAEQDHEFDAGSGVSEIAINAENVKTLKELGLIWGFLKYYHPAVAEGDFNWDYELFRMIPKVVNEKKRAKRDKIIVEWIDGLGSLTENTTPIEIKEEVKIQPDLGWIDHSGFSKALVATLHRVKNAKRPTSNYYIGLTAVGSPEFKHESAYAEMKYPDTGYRMLSLFRYWNMIQYYFPYKNLIEESWEGVLEEFVPRFVGAGNELEYILTTLELIGRVHDTHANLWMYNPALHNYRGVRYAAPTFTFVEGKAVVTDFCNQELGEQTGLKQGDIITEIDGKRVEEIVQERVRITPASNYPTQLRDISQDLLRTNAPTIDVVYTRNGHSETATLTTYGLRDINPYVRRQPESSFSVLDGNIAYLYPALLPQGGFNEQLWNKMKETKGMIVDLRCYPTDFIVFSLGSQLVPRATSFVKFSRGSITIPGLFTMTEELPVGQDNPNYYKGKVVILINENTQSQAEYTTMALRVAPDAVVVGSTTAGADGNVSEFTLPGGLRSMISGIGVYYPDGSETQRVGIIPDIELRPTVAGIAENRDELLEKAIELINEQ